ncbi:hypothetical protein ABEY82_19735 [Priestia megaterium]
MIRQGRIGDEAGIANVHVESWKSTYKGLVPNSFLDSLSAEKRKPVWKKQLESNSIFVAEENGQIALLLMAKKEPASILSIKENCMPCIYSQSISEKELEKRLCIK